MSSLRATNDTTYPTIVPLSVAKMVRYALALSLALAALCLASCADLSNGFGSKLSWQSPATLQVAGLIIRHFVAKRRVGTC